MRRCLIRQGALPESVDELIAAALAAMRAAASRSRQRIHVMTMAELRYQHRVYEQHRSSHVKENGNVNAA
jgi:hypothetical protein